MWRWRGLPTLVVFGVLGAVASTVAVLPVLLESDWVMIEPEGGFFRAHLPTAQRLLNLVLWRNTRTTWGIDYWAYLGLGLLAFSLWGFVAAARGRGRDSVAGRMVLPAAICLLPCLVLYNPVVRDVMFIALFLGLVAAFGIERALTTRGPGRHLSRALRHRGPRLHRRPARGAHRQAVPCRRRARARGGHAPGPASCSSTCPPGVNPAPTSPIAVPMVAP